MRSAKLLALLVGCAIAGGASAETVIVDGHVQLEQSSVARPGRGSTMHQVEAKFGTPAKRYPAVGKPPITRWDYPSFSVFFEYNRVVHSVVHG
jgi:outer membrane protein assembly factor BamE (lipoprotein component of BamABCDE complex)